MSGIDITREERVVPLHQFAIAEDRTQKRLLRSQSTMLVELAEALFNSSELPTNFEKDSTNEVVWRKLSNNSVLLAYRRRS